MHSPLARNPFTTRLHLQQAVRELVAPLRPHFSDGRARVTLGATGAHYPEEVAGLEGFARPLWGLAPLAAGGGAFDAWPWYRDGLTHGSDPQHPEYWGAPGHSDQRLVEMAAIGFALAISPDVLWPALEPRAKKNLAAWLHCINAVEVVDNNWLFFRVLVNLGLARVGARHDAQQTQAALSRVEQFYLGAGWYSDGPTGERDYYSTVMHFYALIYARLAQADDPSRATRFRERAAAFANEFIHWFAADGAALPFGRSLTYRFAQSAFWGALAFADVDVLPWGIVKGLLLRNLRWWARQPIFTDGGLLSIGYAYPNLLMAEQYNSPASPYWAMKSFLPLALPASHPFWRAEEKALPGLDEISVQKHPGMVLCRDPQRDHVFALAGGQYASWRPRHVAEKYAKFAYSTVFGFSVPSAQATEAAGAHDSMLALTEDGLYFRVRHQCMESRLEGHVLYARWQPWEDVEVETWLVPAIPWHIRVHHLHTRRTLSSVEGGFALNCAGECLKQNRLQQRWYRLKRRRRRHYALALSPAGASGLHDLRGERKGRIIEADPNTNLLHPRTVIPALVGAHAPGEYWLMCAVLGMPGCTDATAFWDRVPYVVHGEHRFTVFNPVNDQVILSLGV
jgi:hypothetical protein